MGVKEEFKVKGEELLSKINKIIRDGNVSRIIIKDDKGKAYLDIPVTVGVVGIVLAPFLAAIGTLALLAVDLTIEIIREEDH